MMRNLAQASVFLELVFQWGRQLINKQINKSVLILHGFCTHLREFAYSLKFIRNPKINTWLCGAGKSLSRLVFMFSAEGFMLCLLVSALILSVRWFFVFFKFFTFFVLFGGDFSVENDP